MGTIGASVGDLPGSANSKSRLRMNIDSMTDYKLEEPWLSYDESDRSTVVRLIHENIAVAIITTKDYHPRISESINTWWRYEEFKDVVNVFSDSLDSRAIKVNEHIANLIDTGCENTYNYGIWCKNTYMMEYWRDNEKFKNVKWFVRVMDDTYVHLENLLHTVAQYDHRQKIVIGEKWCGQQGNSPFPVGGSGFILSRAVIEAFSWNDWSIHIKRVKHMNQFIDDMIWGQYLHSQGIPIIHHGGIHQFPSHEGMPLYRYWMQFHERYYTDNASKSGNPSAESASSSKAPSKQNKKSQAKHVWNMDFRPILLHQQGLPIPMKMLHDNLHALRYTPVETDPKKVITIPHCVCNSDLVIRKCFYDEKLLESGRCYRPDDLLECIAPGPWNWFVPELKFPPMPMAVPPPPVQMPQMPLHFQAAQPPQPDLFHGDLHQSAIAAQYPDQNERVP